MTTRKIEIGKTVVDDLAKVTEPREIYVGSGASTATLYKVEEARNACIETCAKEWAKVHKLDADDRDTYWKTIIPQALFDVLEAYTPDYSIVAAEAFLKQFGWTIKRPGDQSVTGDPAELWEEYLAELDGGEPSPQGAMAFAFAKVQRPGDAGAALDLAPEEAAFLKRRVSFLEMVAGTEAFDRNDEEGAALWRIIAKIKALPAEAG